MGVLIVLLIHKGTGCEVARAQNIFFIFHDTLLHSTERRENTKTSSLIYQEDSRVTEASTVLFVLCKLTWTGHERCSVGHQRHLRLAFRLSKA